VAGLAEKAGVLVVTPLRVKISPVFPIDIDIALNDRVKLA